MDTHCTGDAGAIAQVTRAASCSIDAGADDAGAGGGGAGAGYGATMDNTQGDDDDCKYHLSWTASPICEGGGVMFTLVLTNKVDNSPAVGAPIRAEVVLHDTHPAPDTQKTAVEGPPGTYLVGPIKFDAPGQWTVRFHIHEECADLRADSPHGHAAFLVNVP